MKYSSSEKIDEVDLWFRFKSGDKAALSEIYNRYAGILYNYGFHMSSDSYIVEESIQDLFVVLWQSRDRLSNTTSVKFYLFRSLRRQIVSLLNREGVFERNTISEEIDRKFSQPSLEWEFIARETEDQQLTDLKNALTALTPRQVELIRLHFYEGFSMKEVAKIMEMNEQSARNLLQRSVYKLRHVMQFFPLLLSVFQQQ